MLPGRSGSFTKSTVSLHDMSAIALPALSYRSQFATHPDCGLPYPWTEAALNAAEDLASELDLPEIDVTALKATLPDLVRDSPQTTVAASRFRRLIAKAGPLTEDGFKTILVNVVSEAAGRILFPT
jgi:hypothetical protein